MDKKAHRNLNSGGPLWLHRKLASSEPANAGHHRSIIDARRGRAITHYVCQRIKASLREKIPKIPHNIVCGDVVIEFPTGNGD